MKFHNMDFKDIPENYNLNVFMIADTGKNGKIKRRFIIRDGSYDNNGEETDGDKKRTYSFDKMVSYVVELLMKQK